MSETKAGPTPGPWKVRKDGEGWSIHADAPWPDDWHIARATSLPGFGGAVANACLIAAAPDLIMAARAFVAEWDASSPRSDVDLFLERMADKKEPDALGALRAAIAKAEGR